MVQKNLSFGKMTNSITAIVIVISPNFMVWKFLYKSTASGEFSQNFHSSKLGEITLFYAVPELTSSRPEEFF